MQQYSSSELSNNSGSIIRKAQKEPVEITNRGEPVAILLSPEEYQRLGGGWRQLRAAIEETQRQAAANGLTQEKLIELLNEK